MPRRDLFTSEGLTQRLLATWSGLGVVLGHMRGVRPGRATQQQALQARVAELSERLAQNDDFRHRVDDIQRRSVATNDLFLRRVGMELHDGPAQLISLALLRLDALRPTAGNGEQDMPMDDFARIRGALTESLAEIRNISAGLALPELEGVSPFEAIQLAVRNHERRTGSSVHCEIEGLPAQLSNPLKLCLYRFAQEGLNNAFRHAGGRGQIVRGTCRDNSIEVAVVDAGPGFEPDDGMLNGNRLGLTGMRHRIASLGGTFEISSRPGAGTRLTARFDVAQAQEASE